MDTFSIIRDSLAKSEDDPDKTGLDAQTVEAGRVIAAVQTVVDALTPPTGGRWIVGFADIATAGTLLTDQRITVSSKPLRDDTLSLIEKAVVIATFAAHEIGHTYVTRPRKMPVNLIQEHNAFSGYHSVANIADDIILEPFMTERFPILEDAFEFTGLWVLRTTAKSLPHQDTLNSETTPAQRFNILVHATRYGDIPQIEWNDENVIAERDWGRDWQRRLLALPLLDHTGYLALCDEFWERVRTVDDTPPPEPPPLGENPNGTNPEPTDEDGDGEDEDGEGTDDGESDEDTDEDGQPGESEGPAKVNEEPPVGDDFDQDTDEDGEDGDGEDGDEPGGDTGSGDSESESEDGEGDGESNSGDWDGESDDSDHDGDEPGEDGDYDGHDSDEQGGQHGDKPGGGGNAEADNTGTIRDEDEFDSDELDETTHDEAEHTDWRDESLAEKVRTYDSTTVTTFGNHGQMSTKWE